MVIVEFCSFIPLKHPECRRIKSNYVGFARIFKKLSIWEVGMSLAQERKVQILPYSLVR
jgi:hypothetical protein